MQTLTNKYCNRAITITASNCDDKYYFIDSNLLRLKRGDVDMSKTCICTAAQELL